MPVKYRTKIRLGQIGFLLFLLASLEVVVRARWISVLIFSSPSAIALKVWEDIKGAELWTGLQTTAMEFSLAFLISLILGMLFGILFFRFRLFGSAVEPLLLAFYAAPTILLYPVFLTLFGLGSAAVVAMAIVFGSIPIMVNVSVGLAGVEPIFIKLGRSLKTTRWQMFSKIMLPAATPTIFTGLRLGFTYTLVGVIAVEFITFSGGLGKMVSWRYFIFDTEGIFSAIVFVILIAALMNHLLRRTEDRIRTRWT
jgi:NitT/TauT family transport system permease protein